MASSAIPKQNIIKSQVYTGTTNSNGILESDIGAVGKFLLSFQATGRIGTPYISSNGLYAARIVDGSGNAVTNESVTGRFMYTE